MEPRTKHFKKREAILSCLRNTTAHPSAETLHQMLREEHPDISLATVYRNLSLFKEQGIIASLGSVQGVERFDGNAKPHVHYICCQCGSVLDLSHISVPKELCLSAAADAGGEVSGCALTFTGCCGQCAKAESMK